MKRTMNMLMPQLFDVVEGEGNGLLSWDAEHDVQLLGVQTAAAIALGEATARLWWLTYNGGSKADVHTAAVIAHEAKRAAVAAGVGTTPQ